MKLLEQHHKEQPITKRWEQLCWNGWLGNVEFRNLTFPNLETVLYVIKYDKLHSCFAEFQVYQPDGSGHKSFISVVAVGRTDRVKMSYTIFTSGCDVLFQFSPSSVFFLCLCNVGTWLRGVDTHLQFYIRTPVTEHNSENVWQKA